MPVRYEAPGAFDQVFDRVQVQPGSEWSRPLLCIVVRSSGGRRPFCPCGIRLNTHGGVLDREGARGVNVWGEGNNFIEKWRLAEFGAEDVPWIFGPLPFSLPPYVRFFDVCL